MLLKGTHHQAARPMDTYLCFSGNRDQHPSNCTLSTALHGCQEIIFVSQFSQLVHSVIRSFDVRLGGIENPTLLQALSIVLPATLHSYGCASLPCMGFGAQDDAKVGRKVTCQHEATYQKWVITMMMLALKFEFARERHQLVSSLRVIQPCGFHDSSTARFIRSHNICTDPAPAAINSQYLTGVFRIPNL